MKIEKGYTSIQFGQYLKSLTTKEFCILSGAPEPFMRKGWTTEQNALDFMRIDAIKLRLRDDWDKYISQPLTKDMFINPVLHPDKCHKREDYIDDISYEMDYAVWNEVWQEAEKKVIFKNTKLIATDSKRIQCAFEVQKDLFVYLLINNTWTTGKPIKTLSDLFEATKGELELQNVEL